MATPQEGKKAPAFSLPSSTGKKISLKDLAGKKVVLYFYPKDNTPGCTTEACAFRDAHKSFEKSDTVILGVSPDGIASHEKFINKYDLPFVLLADEDHAVAEKYGVWQEKSMYGKKFMGIVRATFVIDREGKIAKIFPKVKVKGHDDEVLEAVKAID
ncbi:MAG: thioredoxin-dependent thiol peroxidase [Candidatus Omnitrophica bacterium]|nr:thioredoxin-dependent thiol peroxidase [Candidatus Omnitrophota bacterium]